MKWWSNQPIEIRVAIIGLIGVFIAAFCGLIGAFGPTALEILSAPDATPSLNFTPTLASTLTPTHTSSALSTLPNTHTPVATFTPGFKATPTASSTSNATSTTTPTSTIMSTATETFTNPAAPTALPPSTATPTNTATFIPSDTPTNTPIAMQPDQTWEGVFNQHGLGYQLDRYPIVIQLEQVRGRLLEGYLRWPLLDDTIITIHGELVQDFGNFTEQSKWEHIEGFKPNEEGTWFKFQEINLIQGANIVMSGWYYAHIDNEGIMRGVYFNANQTEPSGDFTASLSRTID